MDFANQVLVFNGGLARRTGPSFAFLVERRPKRWASLAIPWLPWTWWSGRWECGDVYQWRELPGGWELVSSAPQISPAERIDSADWRLSAAVDRSPPE